MWFFVAVLSRLFFASCNILDSHFVHSNLKSAFSLNFAVAISFLFISIILLCGIHFSVPSHEALTCIVIAGMLQGLYLVPYFAAMKEADSSVVVSLFTLGRATTPLLAYIVIGEQLSVLGNIGFCIVIFGSLFHSYVPQNKKINIKLALLMALSGFMVAGYTVTSKIVFRSEGVLNGYTYILLIGSFSGLSTALIPKLRRDLKIDNRIFIEIWPFFALSVIFSAVANFLFYFSISLTKTSYVTLVAQFQPFFVIIMMWLIGKSTILHTRESFHKTAILQKLVGFLVMLSGMALTLCSA